MMPPCVSSDLECYPHNCRKIGFSHSISAALRVRVILKMAHGNASSEVGSTPSDTNLTTDLLISIVANGESVFAASGAREH